MDWENIKLLNDLYTCYWCPSDGHKYCTHKDLCIYDDNLIKIDKKIVELTKQLPYVGKDIKVGELVINPQREILKEQIWKLKRQRRGKQ